MFDHERDWAMYRKSSGDLWVTPWYRDDLDIFEYDGVTYTRIGPIVKARGIKRAWDLFTEAGRNRPLPMDGHDYHHEGET